MKKHKTLTLFTALLFSAIAFGQMIPPGPSVPPPPPPGLPIDGGLIFLIISGAAYGVAKLKK
jgi:hypothetical protein